MGRKWPTLAAGGYVLVYTAIQVWLAVRTSFHLAVNDFLGLVLIADNVDWSRPETLHNGFFPFALPAILALLPPGTELPVAGLISAAFGAITLLCTYAIASALGAREWALAAPVLLSLNPLFFAYFASPGPDVIATGLATAGLALYARASARSSIDTRIGVAMASGLLFGFAGLFRYHAALLGVGLLTWAALRGSRRGTAVLAAGLGLLLGYLPQVVINLLGGFGPLESDSGFTMYQSVVDINWHATNAIDPQAYQSALGVITAQPFEFLNRYLASLSRFVLPIVVVALAVLVPRRRKRDVVMLSMLVSAVAYAVVVSTGNSPRGLLPVLPLAAVAIAVLSHGAFELTRDTAPAWQRVCAIVAVLGFVVALPNLSESATSAHDKLSAERARAAVEAGVIDSTDIDEAGQILTNDFNLYFTDVAGTNPEKIGGWFNISLNGREAHDDVDLSSVTGFYCDAQRRGVRMVLWSPGSVPGLDPDLEAAFNGGWTTPLLRKAGTIAGYTATVVQPGRYACP